MEMASKLFPATLIRRSDARKGFSTVLGIAIKETEIWNYMLRAKYHFPGEAHQIIDSLEKGNLIKRCPKTFSRGAIHYELTGNGVLASLDNPDLQKSAVLNSFFESTNIPDEASCLMRTLKVVNLLTKSASTHSLLVKLVEGMVELGWNLENLPEKEVNRKLIIILTHALAFSYNSGDNSLREYVKNNSELMPELEVELKIADNMNPEALQSGEQHVNCFRLDMLMIATEYLHAQESLGHRLELFTKSPVNPMRIDVSQGQEREEIINLRKPFETFICYQQNQLVLHNRAIWPHHVLIVLGEFLSGKNLGIYCAAMIRKNNFVECFSIDRGKVCVFAKDLTKCPILMNCARMMKERIENQLKTYGVKKVIPLIPPEDFFKRARVNMKGVGKDAAIFLHFDTIPLEGDR